ncbi:MAG: sodium:alanine symporter family protein [Eubacteriales bacterium]|nr:sodium:alanine symporter family protein [Eubacteriales bacterium]MDY3333230.1 sodium:alanine symporter family protein [Gallibacter sp.]
MKEVLAWISSFVWGIPMIVAIMGVGLIMTIRLRGFQFRKLGQAFKWSVQNEEGGEGDVSSFGALCTTMAATIGTGNIVGVAIAIEVGGPGALFWMIVAACLGMATKYAEGFLAIKYRFKTPDGRFLGGPFAYIENGMGKKWKWLAMLFAFFAAFAGACGIGTSTQMNGVATAVESFVDPQKLHTINIFGNDVTYATVFTAIIVTGIATFAIIGGIKRIAQFTEKLVPAMAIIYVLVALAILIYNYQGIPEAFSKIFRGAFGLDAAAGGVMGAIFAAMSNGVARGIFSNEAGLGSAPIAIAAAQTKDAVRQGLVATVGVFIDTIIICTMTALVVIVTGTYNDPSVSGAAITSKAFGTGLPWADSVGSFVLMSCLALFAFTTILGWNYYGEKCFEYLTGGNMKLVMVYRIVYLAAVFIGPFVALKTIWAFADITNALMALPNLIALVVLSGVVKRETNEYLQKTRTRL